jgi:hypothetical protein
MSNGWSPFNSPRGRKHEREAVRAARRQQKAERLAQHRAEKQAVEQFDNGTFPIADLPVDAQGVFRTLSRRSDVGSPPQTPGYNICWGTGK